MSERRAPEKPIPPWLAAVILVACLGAGGGFVWWSLKADNQNAPTQAVVTPVPVAPDAPPNVDLGQPPDPPVFQPGLRTMRGGGGLAVAPPVRPVPVPEPDVPASTQPATAEVTTLNIGAAEGLVTIHMKDASPQAVMAELAKQLKVDLRTNPPDYWQSRQWPAVVMDFDVERQSLWDAVRLFCQKTRMGITESGAPGAITFSQGNQWPSDGMVTDSKRQVMFRVSNVNRTDVLDLAKPEAPKCVLSISLQVYGDPRLRLMTANGMLQPVIDEAVDDKGNSLIMPPDPRQSVNYGYSRPGTLALSGTQFGVPLAVPSGAGSRIARLRGHLPLVRATKVDILQVDNILGARNVTKTFAGRRICIQQLRKNGGQYQLSLVVYRDDMNDKDWQTIMQQVQSWGTAMRLMDSKGMAMSFGGTNSSRSDRDQLTFTFSFYPSDSRTGTAVGEPVKLVWESAAATENFNAEFEFSNLPLP